MAYIGILPENPSFGTQLARGLGAGLQKGVDVSSEIASKAFLEKQKAKLAQERFNRIEGGDVSSAGAANNLSNGNVPIANNSEQMTQKFIEGLQQLENMTGKELTPPQVEQLWKGFSQMEGTKGQPLQQQSQQHQKKEPTAEDYYRRAQEWASFADDPAAKQQASINISRAEAAQKSSREREKQEFHREETGLKETKELRNKLSEGYRTSLTNEKIYDSMKKLNDKDLATPFQAMLSEKLGVPISVLSNPESEQYQKLEQTLTRQISNYYPGQIRVIEFESFLRQIPTLLNSKEGRGRILNTLKALDEIPKLEFESYRQIVKENGRKIPFDLNEQLAERMAKNPKLEEIGKKLDKSINPGGKILMLSPDGTMGYVDEENVEKAQSKGYKPYGG